MVSLPRVARNVLLPRTLFTQSFHLAVDKRDIRVLHTWCQAQRRVHRRNRRPGAQRGQRLQSSGPGSAAVPLPQDQFIGPVGGRHKRLRLYLQEARREGSCRIGYPHCWGVEPLRLQQRRRSRCAGAVDHRRSGGV